MSDNIPFEIQSQIMRSLPVKSLLRFRSVCKSWKSLIESSDFIAHYTSQQQHLLVRCYDYSNNSERQHFSIVDDDSLLTQRVSVTLPEFIKYPNIIGSSHGLLCFYGLDGPTSGTGSVVILNPCIRKSLAFVVPRVTYENFCRTVLGFGVCRETNDPKIVKITQTDRDFKGERMSWEVEVFTLSKRVWRSPYSSNVPRKSIYLYWDTVIVNGCLYWLAREKVDGIYNLIISFDVTSEEFREVNLPDSLAHGYHNLSMYKLRESLAVIEIGVENLEIVYHVWMMTEDDVPNSFIELYTVSCQSPDVPIYRLSGFRKTGEPLVEVIFRAQHDSTRVLTTYDPYSKCIGDVMINGISFSCFVHSYMETLLLL